MTIAVLRKYTPAADGFFDLDPSEDDRRAQLAVARAAVAVAHGEPVRRELDLLTEPAQADGVYVLSAADAADLNRLVDFPEQPVYDWTDVRDTSDEDE